MTFLDLLFPRKCLGCGKTGGYFCPECLNFVTLANQSICPVCEKPSIGGLTHPSCRVDSTLDGVTSIFSYKGIIVRAISKLKYKFVSDIATDFVEIFVSLCGEDRGFVNYLHQNNAVIVPVPLHPNREKWRGFNQTELLGKLIAAGLGIGFIPNLLVRVKNTKPQVGLGEEERKKNIKNAFTLSRDDVIKRSSDILLFDDVWTSGSTLRESGRVLKRAGAKTVWGLTLAR